MPLPSNYNPKEFEPKIYTKWEDGRVGSPEEQARRQGHEVAESTEPTKYLIFDFDGVLGDTWEALVQSTNLDSKHPSLEYTTQSLIEHFETPKFARSREVSEEELSKEIAWHKDFSLLINKIGFKLFDGFVSEIKKLQNTKLAVVSSGSQYIVKPALTNSGLDFTHILCFEDHQSKEEKIERICKDWGVEVKEIYYFTDTKADVLELERSLDKTKIVGCSWDFHGYDRLNEVLPGQQILKEFGNIQGIWEMEKKQKILFATTNQSKINRLIELTASLPIHILTLKDLDYIIPEPEEIGQDMRENALVKARHYWLNLKEKIPVITEDQGIFFDDVEEKEQPGKDIKDKVKAKYDQATDENIIKFYIELANKYGGELQQNFYYTFGFFDGQNELFDGFKLQTLLVSRPLDHWPINYPLGAITKILVKGKLTYWSDVSDSEMLDFYVEQGLQSFLQNFITSSLFLAFQIARNGPPTFTILMPPPNLTGILHAGHSLGHYIMDTLTRIHRQKGHKSLWYPGVDHAGIQLEGVIDKLIKQGEFKAEIENSFTENKSNSKVALPEDHSLWPAFLKKHKPKLWLELAWTKANGWRSGIEAQSVILGDTPDYTRSLFTLDERANKMVNYAFVKYWQDNLLYKSSYLINWSVGLQTALSDVQGDIEYENRIDPFVTFEYEAKRFELKSPESLSDVDLKSFLEIYLKPCSLWPRLELGTVRIETKFTDLAVAMHPEKFPLYFNLEMFETQKTGFSKELAEQFIELIRQDKVRVYYYLPPVKSGELQLVITPKVDPNFGTGILKITPGHDIFDYELYHELVKQGILEGDRVQTSIGRDGKLSEVCGEYAGLRVEQGRLAVIKILALTGYISVKAEFKGRAKEILTRVKNDLENESFDPRNYSYQEGQKFLRQLIGPELAIDWDYSHNVAICERSKTVIEPLISEEFFLSYHRQYTPSANAEVINNSPKTLQQLGLEGIAETSFFSEDFRERAVNFVENIKDWCISRDLVWGHRMPVWYCENCNPSRKFGSPEDKIQGLVVVEEKPAVCPDCGSDRLVQEVKILDTWFSSGLWPLTTLDFYQHLHGETSDFATYFPTQVLLSAREIFYIWIVRMIMLSKYFTGKTPFQNVVIHPTVLDEHGRKMSKSLKNGLDPIGAIEKYSSDSLRMAMLGGMIPNRNFRLGGSIADKSCEKYRNFGNKVWNVARFLESKEKVS